MKIDRVCIRRTAAQDEASLVACEPSDVYGMGYDRDKLLMFSRGQFKSFHPLYLRNDGERITNNYCGYGSAQVVSRLQLWTQGPAGLLCSSGLVKSLGPEDFKKFLLIFALFFVKVYDRGSVYGHWFIQYTYNKCPIVHADATVIRKNKVLLHDLFEMAGPTTVNIWNNEIRKLRLHKKIMRTFALFFCVLKLIILARRTKERMYAPDGICFVTTKESFDRAAKFQRINE